MALGILVFGSFGLQVKVWHDKKTTALKTRGAKAILDRRERCAAEGRVSPEGMLPGKFEIKPGHEFKIVPEHSERFVWDDD